MQNYSNAQLTQNLKLKAQRLSSQRSDSIRQSSTESTSTTVNFQLPASKTQSSREQRSEE